MVTRSFITDLTRSFITDLTRSVTDNRAGAGRGVVCQLLRDQAGQQRAIHAHQVRHVARQHLFEDRANAGMIAAQREHAPAGQKIQIAMAIGIEEPFALAANIAFVEADGADHPDEGRIQMAFVQFILTPLLSVQPIEKSLFHEE